MDCMNCGGLVIWKGPITALTHTECQKCGGINCQDTGADPDDELFDEDDMPVDSAEPPMEHR